MMGGGGFAGTLGYIVPLCLITGILIIRWEVVGYGRAKMGREKKFARVLGWINVLCGIGLYVGNWLFAKWT